MKYFKLLPISFCFFLTLLTVNGYCQLVVNPNQTATVLASTLAGPGTIILAPKLTCLGIGEGTFTATGTLLSMSNGIVLTNGHASACSGPEGPLVSFNAGTPGDPAMAPFLPPGTATVDACILEFDVVAQSDTLSFNYQFGSEEYRNAVCSIYTDVFAFFISGPGIVGTPNMALVPGTNIPVEINSVNNGGLGTVGGAAHINCTSLGAGSPFTAYYIDNTGGPNMTYRGYTKKFRAFHAVTTCDTYHLKLSIVDAGNWQYDSGVFLEGGSLHSNSYSFDRLDSLGATINGVPHTIVKGCSGTSVTIQALAKNPTPVNLTLSFGGTAVNGVDVSPVPSIITLPADSTTVTFNVNAIPTPPGGPKTFIIYLHSVCGIADSVTLNILDSPSAMILTPDTTICAGQSFQLRVTGTPGLTYTWAPGTGLSSTTVMEPIASPVVSTIYTMTATLPGSGCPPIVRDIIVSIHDVENTIATPNDTICFGGWVNILLTGSSSYNYQWTPSAGLNNPKIENPVATPTVTTTYSVTTTDGTCSTTSSLTISVLTPSVTMLTQDTAICYGASMTLRATGDPTQTYSWAPSSGLSDPGILDPIAAPTVSTIYTITATVTTPQGMPCVANSHVVVNVVPPPIVTSPDQAACINSTISLSAGPAGDHFTYRWSGPDGFTSDLEYPQIFKSALANQGVYTVTVTDDRTTCSGSDTAVVKLYTLSLHLANVTLDATIKYGSSIQLNADSAVYYMWKPDDGSLNNANINNPVATPLAPTEYMVYGIDQHGCLDSAKVNINVTYDNIFIPDAFTPNGDGLNDVFRVGDLHFFKLDEFRIYNRWGQQLFSAIGGENTGWDGTYNGVPQDMGVYYYLISVTSPQGQKQSFKGNITLIR